MERLCIALCLCAAVFAARAEFDFADEQAWQVKNYENRLSIDRVAVVDGAPCFVARGAADKKADTALSLLSKRISLPADAGEFMLSVETRGSKLSYQAFKKGSSYCNGILWYGADGTLVDEQPLPHVLVTPAHDFQRMYEWGKIPSGAVACEIRLGTDHPNLVGAGDFVSYRNFRFRTIPKGESREAAFASAWKDDAWLKRALYPGPARSGVKVTLRDDGVTIVDGEPFFPIGIYSVIKREFNGRSFDRAFADLKAAGFNFAHTYGDAYESDFLAAAEKYGIRLWVASGMPSRNLLDVGRYHPSIIAWYLGDDSSRLVPVSELAARNAAVKAVDPNRLTCQADDAGSVLPISNYAPYVRHTDVFMPEIYPVTGEAGDKSDRTCVARTIQDMEQFHSDVRRFGDGKPKGCWPILQWFDGWSLWHHFPSREQLRATTFAALVHGANGMIWYTYGGLGDNHGATSTPERWRTLCELATELKGLAPIFLERTPVAQPKVEIVSGPAKDALDRGPSVTCLLKRHQGKDCLFAVNAAAESVTARITLPNGSVHEEKFDPLGVLVSVPE